MTEVRPDIIDNPRRHSWAQRVVALVSGALLAVTLAGCSTDSATETPLKTLSVGATLEPDTLDLTTSDSAAIPQVLLYNVYETLVRLDGEGTIKPLLATGYDVSSDGLTYTFRLDRQAEFASGAPVDADAVVESIERMRQAPSATLRAQHEVVASVEAVDAATVEVELSRPSNMWLYNMTQKAGIVIDPAATDLATAPMGSGPFMVEDWLKGDRVVLEKNIHYWGTPGRFDEVDFRYIADPNAMVSALLSGDIDIISDLTSPDSLSQFSDASRFTIIDGTSNAEVVLGFNHSRPALQDLRVRQAICYAIDRAGLLDAVWGGKGVLIGSMVAPTDPWYEDLSQTYPYDPQRARDLLAEAGVSGLNLSLRVPTLPYATAGAQFIASQLSLVGINVTVEELDFSSRWLTEVFTNAEYDMTIVSHVEPRDITMFADPTYYWRYDNPTFAQLVASADEAPDQQRYVTLMEEAATMLADDAAADWLFNFPNLVVTKAGITGIPDNATTLSFDVTTIASRQ
ncbi:MAG: ABC transporter substrate-binding protein [Propionibacteriaceae bacterium]|jgi:peptide/nickel transport system substrate-binding protein|nr:ABC transporter substrate-binding protein [Propionibacteriaceae bacterium]